MNPQEQTPDTAVTDLVNAGCDEGEAGEWINELLKKYKPESPEFAAGVGYLMEQAIPSGETLGAAVLNVLGRIKQHWGKDAIGIPTPAMPGLSDQLCGWRGLVVLSSMPGIGKTSLAFHAMLDAVKNDDKVCGVMLSYEMSREEMAKRLLCMITGVSFKDLSLGRGGAEDAIDSATETLEEWRGFLNRILIIDADTVPQFTPSETGSLNDPFWEINKLVNDFQLKTGTERSFVMVDYMQALPVCTPEGHMDWRSDMDRDRYTISGLNKLQERLGTDNPLVVISEQRKDSYDKPGGMASILGTGRASYSADAIIILDSVKEEERGEELQAAGVGGIGDLKINEDQEILINARLVKGRDGMTRGNTLLVFNYGQTSYREATPHRVKL